MGVNSLLKIVTRQRRGCDLNPGPSAPASSTLTTRLPSHPIDIGYTALFHVLVLLLQLCHVALLRVTRPGDTLLAAWHMVSGVRRMNEVTARRARLVPGWVTVFGRVYHLGM